MMEPVLRLGTAIKHVCRLVNIVNLRLECWNRLPQRNQTKAESESLLRQQGIVESFRSLEVDVPPGVLVAPMYDQSFSPLMGPSAPARAESEIDIGRIGLLDEAPEDLPGRNQWLVIPEVIPADVHQPDQTTLTATRNRKHAS
jgi:hypothetical protein